MKRRRAAQRIPLAHRASVPLDHRRDFSRFDNNTQRAFTLLELVVVIAIMAMLVTLVMISLGGTMDRYHLRRAVESIEMLDAKARRSARDSRQSMTAVIERSRNRMRLIDPSNDIADERHMPQGVEIQMVRMPRRIVAGNRLEIPYSGDGWSPTYAVKLQRGATHQWLVVLGISGQVIGFDKEEDVNEMLSL